MHQVRYMRIIIYQMHMNWPVPVGIGECDESKCWFGLWTVWGVNHTSLLKLHQSWTPHEAKMQIFFATGRECLIRSFTFIELKWMGGKYSPMLILRMCDYVLTVISTVFQSYSMRPVMWLAERVNNHQHFHWSPSHSPFHVALPHIQYMN